MTAQGHKFRRAHLRAPLKGDVLYIDDGHALRARGDNISGGGILLESMPHVPAITDISLMFSLTVFPEFHRCSPDILMDTTRASLDRQIFRGEAKIVRSFEGLSEAQRAFVTKIGCQFTRVDEKAIAAVTHYVSTFSRNIVHVLSLFQSNAKTEQIVHLAGMLGYQTDEKMPMLRLKILHDYQSLEGL
jgi:c-di-GMP-binding flagellar brake protein YcgR